MGFRPFIRENVRRWNSNPSGKCSYERPARGTVCGTMRSMCGADAGCSAMNFQSLCARQVLGLRPQGAEVRNHHHLSLLFILCGLGCWVQGFCVYFLILGLELELGVSSLGLRVEGWELRVES